jgi:hypothetical protein
MFRSLLLVATILCAFDCSTAHAQRFGGKWFRGGGKQSKFRGPSTRGLFSQPSLFGFGISIGSYPSYDYPRPGGFDPYRFDNYVHDPYRSGSFEPPDLLNDPYFRERHRYDSHFPGRGSRDPFLVRTAPPLQAYAPPVQAYAPRTAVPPYAGVAGAEVAPVYPNDFAGQLKAASQQLTRSLSAQKHGNDWIKYLAPHRIRLLIAVDDTAELRELLAHYDGVIGNPQLRSVAESDGFAATHILLYQYLNRGSESAQPLLTEPQRNEPQREELPLPQRIAVPESLPVDDNEI